MMNWWMQSGNNAVEKLLLDTMPIIISWNLWKNRCAAKYGGKSSSVTRTLYSITSDLLMLLKSSYTNVNWPLNWSEIYQIVEKVEHHTSVHQVLWHKPTPSFVKTNSDGSALGNPGKIGAGVIIRGQQGQFIHAIACPLGVGTNNQAETEAAYLGIKWCIENDFTKLHLEADSKLLILWLTTSSEAPWEANCPADSLSKLSHDLTTLTHFNSQLELPPHIRGQIILDQQNTPAFRHKKTTRVIFPAYLLPNNPNDND
ncbi:hypothetical protein A4A49_52256 [Nicotiana attenuata]|uniref:RNase H type-1 domain-containing protein n=1 Tax=Nicotiana attenuata TaxID=49451 RepID=A0A314KX48_NICAT|nr:hypothetical protein A4A49_52256 [Nicotiana attenuata]